MTSNDIVTNSKNLPWQAFMWGGESEAEGGYDCSGFVYSVLNKCGMKVPMNYKHRVIHH